MQRLRLQPRTLRRCFSSIAGDNWGSERLGKFMKNPLHGYSERLEYQQKEADNRKNTFNKQFFRSKDCRSLLKIAWEGAVRMTAEDGQHVAMAGRYIRKGELIERGILRAMADDCLDEFVPNPFVLRLGHDFLLALSDTFHDNRAPPFLASGTVMTYKRVVEDYNVELTVRESHAGGFEFDVVATDDIPIGEPLRRRVAPACQREFASTPKYAEFDEMTDAAVEHFLEYQSAVDARNAAKLPPGVEAPILHRETILEHARMTASRRLPILNVNRTVCLPHPVWDGYGVFASEPIKKGEIVESGMMHQLQGLDGNKNPYVFTWNKDGQRHEDPKQNQWCTGGGNVMFYNSDYPANCRMYRFHDHFRYLIVATQDIAEGEECMHLYVSSAWRTCFVNDDYLPKPF